MTDYTDPLKMDQIIEDIRSEAREYRNEKMSETADMMDNWANRLEAITPTQEVAWVDNKGQIWGNGYALKPGDKLFTAAAPQQAQAGDAEQKTCSCDCIGVLDGGCNCGCTGNVNSCKQCAALQPQPQAVDEREAWKPTQELLDTLPPTIRQYIQSIEARAALSPKVQEPVMADGVTPLSDYLERAVPDEECGDDWTKGYEECKRRLFKIVGDQLRSMGATAAQQSDTHPGSDHASRPGSQSNAEAAQVVRDKLDSLTVYGNNQQAEAQSKGEKQ